MLFRTSSGIINKLRMADNLADNIVGCHSVAHTFLVRHTFYTPSTLAH